MLGWALTTTSDQRETLAGLVLEDVAMMAPAVEAGTRRSGGRRRREVREAETAPWALKRARSGEKRRTAR